MLFPDSDRHREIDAIQSRHRANLVATWDIGEGATILEVGCGQGDMTRVLANAVGSKGRVVAVDIADENYGSPQTLRQATDQIAASAVGDRIEFRFEFDIQDPKNAFGDREFDAVVLAHSSWYVSSSDELRRIFQTVRCFADKLLFAEWDLEPQLYEQLPHLLAVLIQGQIESFKSESTANVRTPLHKSTVRTLIKQAGWSIERECTVDAQAMQDADWEIQECLRHVYRQAEFPGIPEKTVRFLAAQQEVLRGIAKPTMNSSLPAYSILAR